MHATVVNTCSTRHVVTITSSSNHHCTTQSSLLICQTHIGHCTGKTLILTLIRVVRCRHRLRQELLLLFLTVSSTVVSTSFFITVVVTTVTTRSSFNTGSFTMPQNIWVTPKTLRAIEIVLIVLIV